ncbi:MAG: response regulator transcription factor [Bacteroidota bacterium]
MADTVPIRVFLVDDHQIILDGLQALLSSIADIEVVGEANSGRELLQRLPLTKVEVILMDVDMPHMDGREATQQVKRHFPDLKVIILSMHHSQEMVRKLMQAGANGYVLKNADQAEVVQAIRQVKAGKSYFSGQITETLLQPQLEEASTATLTSREREILILVAEGFTNIEIGNQLHISPRTVDSHRTNLMKKLSVNNVAGLIRYAFRKGMIE